MLDNKTNVIQKKLLWNTGHNKTDNLSAPSRHLMCSQYKLQLIMRGGGGGSGGTYCWDNSNCMCARKWTFLCRDCIWTLWSQIDKTRTDTAQTRSYLSYFQQFQANSSQSKNVQIGHNVHNDHNVYNVHNIHYVHIFHNMRNVHNVHIFPNVYERWSLNECARAYFVQLQRFSLLIQTKCTTHAVAHWY